jgi:hypothetical protein
MFAFLHFNAVLFTQYMAWTVPFIPLCLRDWLDRKPPDTSAVGETGAEAPSAHAGENASAEADMRASGSS